jgi:hypothetical protein
MSLKRRNSDSDFDIIDRSSIPSHESVVNKYVKPFLSVEEKTKQRNSGNFFTRFFDRQQIKDEEHKKGRHLTDKELAELIRKQTNRSTSSASNQIYSPSNKSRSESSRRQGGRHSRIKKQTRLVKKKMKKNAKTLRRRK